MSHNTEQSRPDHLVHHVHMPQGHGYADQKHDKGMRAPIVSQLPMANGLESPQVDSDGPMQQDPSMNQGY